MMLRLLMDYESRTFRVIKRRYIGMIPGHYIKHFKHWYRSDQGSDGPIIAVIIYIGS